MELTRQTKEQIKMLVECGISKTSIASEYDISMAELEAILNPTTTDTKTSERGRKEWYQELSERNRQKGIDNYNKLKPLVDNWKGSVKGFIDRYKISMNTYYRVKNSNTAEEYLSKRKDWEKPKETNQDRRDARKEATKSEKPTISPELIELRAINDSLARIAEALEKKHKWFRR